MKDMVCLQLVLNFCDYMAIKATLVIFSINVLYNVYIILTTEARLTLNFNGT